MDQRFPHLDSPAEFRRAAAGYWYGSLGVSTIVHVCAIAALASLWTHSEGGPGITAVNTRWSAEKTHSQFDQTEQIPHITPPVEMNVVGAQSSPVMLQSEQDRPLQVDAPPTRFTMPVSWFVRRCRFGKSSPDDALTEVVGAVSGGSGDLAAIGGDGAGRGEGGGSGGGFFGSRAAGRRFVYVVDCSRSMNHPHASEARTRFRRLKIELVRSIASMDPDMQFFIVFFNDRALPMPARSLRPAIPKLQKRYLRWAATVPADGNTDPRLALYFALSLNPDVIYFLTDGSFEPPIRRDLAKLKQDRVAIHTFAFGNRAAEDMLRALALANGGEYHFVP